jgi:hypothetical protein
VDGHWFDGSASLLECHRRLQVVAGSASWIPTHEPQPWTHHHLPPTKGPASSPLMLLLDGHFHNVYSRPSTFLRVSLNIRGSDERPTTRCYFSETFPSAPIILYPRFQICVCRRWKWSGHLFLVTRGENFRMIISFFGIETSAKCGPPSNLNLVHFIWEHSERLSFAKYAILVFPSNCRNPSLMFLKYYRVRSDGWTDVEGCQACIERYQGAICTLNNCELPNICHCNICTRQPPSLRDSASHVLFRCVLASNALNWPAIPPIVNISSQLRQGASMIYVYSLPAFLKSRSGSDSTRSKTNSTITVRVRENGVRRCR